MPNKKPQINPFSMYMREQEPKLRREGIHFNTKKELVDYLFPHFNALSELERTKYKNMAKNEKEAAKHDLTRKYDDRGIPLSQLAAEQRELQQKRDRMLAEVKRLVHGRDGNTAPLLNAKFYTMFISLHCFTDRGKETEYIPCEISICEWTIADGVDRSCSYFVEPDSIPMGYKSRCLDLSEKTHRVPLDFELAEQNLPGVWIRLKNFINPQEDLPVYPPVFTRRSEIEHTEGALEWLYDRSMDRRSNPFRVYPLERLLFELFAAIGEPQNTETPANDLLRQGHFDYLSDLACGYHAEQDNSQFCTLAMARRHAMLILDRVVFGFGVELKPGKHVPLSTADAGTVINTPILRGDLRPFDFKPSREKEPDLPTEYSLIQPTKSRFRGGDKDVSVGPDGEQADSSWRAANSGPPDLGDDNEWSGLGATAAPAPPSPASTFAANEWSTVTARPRKPTGMGRSVAMAGSPPSSIVSCQSSWRTAPTEYEAAAAPPSVASETDFPSLGSGSTASGGGRAPRSGLMGRSKPLNTQPRAPGISTAAAIAANPNIIQPVIGRGRSGARTVAERFAAWPGLKE